MTGFSAFMVDYFRAVDDVTPFVFAFVLGLSFLLLMVAFRSLVVPLKAIILNLLSLGAAYGRLVQLQEMGFGLAVAVFLDATIVRSVLVPASMALLGNANWYLPGWLRWLPDLRIEGQPAAWP